MEFNRPELLKALVKVIKDGVRTNKYDDATLSAIYAINNGIASNGLWSDEFIEKLCIEGPDSFDELKSNILSIIETLWSNKTGYSRFHVDREKYNGEINELANNINWSKIKEIWLSVTNLNEAFDVTSYKPQTCDTSLEELKNRRMPKKGEVDTQPIIIQGKKYYWDTEFRPFDIAFEYPDEYDHLVLEEYEKGRNSELDEVVEEEDDEYDEDDGSYGSGVYGKKFWYGWTLVTDETLKGKVVTDNRRLDYDVQLSWLGIDRDDIALLYSTIGDEYP